MTISLRARTGWPPEPAPWRPSAPIRGTIHALWIATHPRVEIGPNDNEDTIARARRRRRRQAMRWIWHTLWAYRLLAATITPALTAWAWLAWRYDTPLVTALVIITGTACLFRWWHPIRRWIDRYQHTIRVRRFRFLWRYAMQRGGVAISIVDTPLVATPTMLVYAADVERNEVRVRITLVAGQTIDQLVTQRKAIASALDATVVHFDEVDDHPRRAIGVIQWGRRHDPLRQTIDYPDRLPVSLEAVTVAADSTRGPNITWQLTGAGQAVHFAVYGQTGGGKSSYGHAAVHGLAGLDNLALFIVDPKTVEFAGWAERATCICDEPEQADVLLDWLLHELDERRRKMPKRQMTEATTDMPWLVLVWDELTDWLLSGPGAKERTRKLIRLLSKGRSFGVRSMLLTQNPHSDIMSTAIRQQIGRSVVCRVANAQIPQQVFGARPEGVDPHLIPEDMPGVGWTQTGGRYRRVRSLYLSDERIERRAAETASKRVELPVLRQHLLSAGHGACLPDVDLAPMPVRYTWADTQMRAVALHEGGMSIGQIVDALNAGGYPTKSGRGKLHRSKVHEIIRGTA